MPTTELSDEDFDGDAISVADMLVKAALVPSRSEAKRLIKDGGVTVADEKVTAFDATVPKDSFKEGLIVKKGKKTYHRFVLK